jgi:hypothetical protein
MAQTLTNPRFPHICKIYRMIGADSFSDGEVKVIYYGVCKKSMATNIRNFNSGSDAYGKVDSGDVRISMPGLVTGIHKGDFVKVVDPRLAEQTEEDGEISFDSAMEDLRVVSQEATQLGLYELQDEEGNVEFVAGGTAVMCSEVSN